MPLMVSYQNESLEGKDILKTPPAAAVLQSYLPEPRKALSPHFCGLTLCASEKNTFR